MRCDTSRELGSIDRIIGQDRALEALKFGVEMKGKGFNIYAAGLPGTGKNTVVRRYLHTVAKGREAPSDWCYVNNFQNSYEPKALRLPRGRAKAFQRDMEGFIEELQRLVPAALQSDELQSRREVSLRKAEGERARIFEGLSKEANGLGYVVQATPVGMNLVPSVQGKPMTEEEFEALPSAVKEQFNKNRPAVESRLERAAKALADLDARTKEGIQKLRDDAVRRAISLAAQSLTARYQEISEVVAYLKGAQEDILENADLFAQVEGEPPGSQKDPALLEYRSERGRRYEVNVIVDNAGLKEAPIIDGDNPTYPNLLGRIEAEARFGALHTDFTLIKGGLLHQANGGYLILRIDDLGKNPASYDGLKRALQSGRIAIEETGERLGMSSTKSLTPEPIPLDVKVVLIGDPSVYQLLYANDPDFGRLFKVKAHFDDAIPRNAENVEMYGRFVHTLCEDEGLNHLEAPAIAKIVEHGSRLAEDQDKLSTKFSELGDLIREASLYATRDGSKAVKATHIERALEERTYRSNLIDQKLKEMVARGVLLIDTSGSKVGQVNGLTVMDLGDFEFGQPSRVTASVGLGRDGIIDIEREAKLGGQIHTKGVLIISGYLAERYGRDKPLSLACRIVFEQSYGGVEGDSASSTELYAIISALADLPVKQNLAVTGSVNQKGEIQAIGGANEKIEGFFEVCKAKGLTGDEGVLIPESNVQHLMLREEVVEAVRKGRFHIWAVKTIDDGIEILTGVKAGALRRDGTFDSGSVNDRVDRRLAVMAAAISRFAAPTGGGSPPGREDEEGGPRKRTKGAESSRRRVLADSHLRKGRPRQRGRGGEIDKELEMGA